MIYDLSDLYGSYAYHTNLLVVMLAPSTWVIAAIVVFALRRRSIAARLLIAFAVSLGLSLLLILWPTGDWRHAYGVPAVLRQVAATVLWTVLFLLAQRLFSRRDVKR